MNSGYIFNLIKNFKKNVKRTLFTTPSHNQGTFIDPISKKMLGRKVFECDFSEIVDFDNFANPQGVIKKALNRAATIYNSQKTFFLTNGSSSGILALMLIILKKNDKVIISRNAHRCVFNGLVLSGARPVWVMGDYNKDFDIYMPVSFFDVEKAVENNPDAKVLILTNPTYEGLIGNIEEIAIFCRQKEIILIVDEAHGALWNFNSTLGTPAIVAGADASVQSLHKTAGALNPSALLHIAVGSKINPTSVQETLNLINTSSPSYPILFNIESCINFLMSFKGKKKVNDLINLIENFKKELKSFENIEIFNENNDCTKLLIKIKNMSGFSLEKILFEKFNIEVEMANNFCVLCLTGIGTSKKSLNKLKKALIKISQTEILLGEMKKPLYFPEIDPMPEPVTNFTPQEVRNMDFEETELINAENKICAEVIIEYPPAIPLIVPGERINAWHKKNIKHQKTIKTLVLFE